MFPTRGSHLCFPYALVLAVNSYSHNKACLSLLLPAGLIALYVATHAMRERTEGRRAVCYERLQWKHFSISAGQGFGDARPLWGGRRVMRTQEMLEKVNGQVPSKKVSCQGKACGLVSSERDGSREALESGIEWRKWSRSLVGLVSPMFHAAVCSRSWTVRDEAVIML